jgi:ferredoxin
MPKVHFLNEILTVDAQKGQTIEEVASAAGVTLHRGMWTWGNCRGLGFCGSCQVWAKPIDQAALSERSFFERMRMVQGQVRLGCQARVLGDCEVRTKPGGPPAAQNVEWREDPRPFKWKERLHQKQSGDDADDADAAADAEPPAAASKP